MTTHAKHDPITQRIENAALWAARHWQQVALGVSTLLVAGLIALAMARNLKQSRGRHWEQYASAQSQYYRGEIDPALQSVNNLVPSVRSGPIVSLARLLKGDILLKQKKNDDAAQAYKEAYAQAYTSDIKALSAFGLAFTLEQAQKWPDSEKGYQAFIAEFPEHYLVGRAYESLGRVQMVQQRWADAQASFERLVSLFPTTEWAKNAETYLAQIKTQLQATSKK
jgi:predicted Zn-dependent protease